MAAIIEAIYYRISFVKECFDFNVKGSLIVVRYNHDLLANIIHNVTVNPDARRILKAPDGFQ